MKHEWTEASIGREVVKTLFKGQVLAIPCTSWTGHEADLLIVTKDLRLIDVEIKISRADLKADLVKDKWWRYQPWSRREHAGDTRTRREWPPKVWKHYYCMPAAVWSPDLAAGLPGASGVVLIDARGSLQLERRAQPNKKAQPIDSAQAIDLARLAGLRMWDALHRENKA